MAKLVAPVLVATALLMAAPVASASHGGGAHWWDCVYRDPYPNVDVNTLSVSVGPTVDWAVGCENDTEEHAMWVISYGPGEVVNTAEAWYNWIGYCAFDGQCAEALVTYTVYCAQEATEGAVCSTYPITDIVADSPL